MPLERAFTRGEILERLKRTISDGRPILGAGSSVGLVAKCAEIGGADLIIVYSTGRSRIMGLPTTPLGDSNRITIGMYDEIANVVDDTPIIGGADATDPTYMSLRRLLDQFRAAGYSGIINFPTVGGDRQRNAARSDVGLGFTREVEMVRLARGQDFFTMAYVFDPVQAAQMAAVGVDVLVPHVGWTRGGLAGATASAVNYAMGAERVQAMIDAALREQPECICLAHGGPFATPEDTDYLYAHTAARGFVGASSIERIPIETAVRDAVMAFKERSLRG